jgi:hypothetical protein
VFDLVDDVILLRNQPLIGVTLQPLKLAILVAGVTVTPATATIEYKFDYTATSGTVQSFSFSLTAPGFITSAGQSPAFSPFTIGDGTTSWTFTQDLTGFSPPTTAVFCFATAGTLVGPNCTASYHPPNGFFEATFVGGFPTAPGVYASNFGGSFYLPDSSLADINLGTGTLVLTIGQINVVPEPGSILLMLTVVAGVAFARFRVLRMR